MVSHIFLQSGVQDPYTIYNDRLLAQPVFWDEQNQLWVIYSYQLCREIFMHPDAYIPPVSTEGFDEYALAIINRLVRLSNPPMHAAAKQAALLLFRYMQEPRVRDIMTGLVPVQAAGLEIDWVDNVGRKLPVLSILQGFGIGREESIFIAGRMDALLSIMRPVKTMEQVAIINAIARNVYTLLEAQLLRTGFIKEVINALVSTQAISPEEALALCVSNLAGLLVQSYDAGRGILGNALLQLLRHPAPAGAGSDYIQASVVETCRFDPPVHNTRRVAGQDMRLGGYTIQKGQMILLVVAAANRDARQFKDPARFDTERPNNDEHLTFGLGAHACVAKAFSTRLAAEALSFLFDAYTAVHVVDKNIEYESLVNARVPRRIFIACSK
jgi:cytochrome P450